MKQSPKELAVFAFKATALMLAATYVIASGIGVGGAAIQLIQRRGAEAGGHAALHDQAGGGLPDVVQAWRNPRAIQIVVVEARAGGQGEAKGDGDRPRRRNRNRRRTRGGQSQTQGGGES